MICILYRGHLDVGELHLHINTVRRWSNEGILKPYRVGPRGDRRFLRDNIIHFLTTQGYSQQFLERELKDINDNQRTEMLTNERIYRLTAGFPNQLAFHPAVIELQHIVRFRGTLDSWLVF